MIRLNSRGNGYGSDGSGDDWTFDLEDIIEQQTRQQAGLEEDAYYRQETPGAQDDGHGAYTHPHRKSGEAYSARRAHGGERGDEEEDLLFEEDEEEEAYAEYREYGEDEADDDGDDGDDLPVKKETRRERRAARKQEKEYEEFQAYQKGKKKAKRKKKRHRIRKVLLILLIAALLIYALGNIALRLLGIQTGLDASEIQSLISEEVLNNSAMSGYTNIALFGVDSRDEDLGEGNRTDVMIIASINNSTGDIQLVSVYRDTYLDIGDGDYQKANAAYAYGGAEQAITMLNTNLDLDITDYVTIGFAGVADLIDTVGGVEIEVTEDEITHLNNYQSTMAEELGMEYAEVTSTGTQTLNGLQAVAYCRIRYTDGGDFERTERQKEVLSQVFSKLRSSGPLTIIQAAGDLSGEIETSLSTTEIASLAMKVFSYEISGTSGFPNEDMRTTGYIGDASCVIPVTLEDNVVWLHEYLFGDEDYQVSSNVQTISDYISSVTGYY